MGGDAGAACDRHLLFGRCAFLFAYYTAGAGELPWDLANSLERRVRTASVLGLGLICWVVVRVTTLSYARALRARLGHHH